MSVRIGGDSFRMNLQETMARPRTRRLLGIAAGLLLLWAVAGFLVLPRFLRPIVEKRLAAQLHRPVTLRRLSLNPFTLSATLEGLDVKDRGDPFFSFESLYVNLEAVSLFRGGPVIRAITLARPAVTLVRKEDGTYNVQDLLDEAAKPKPPLKPGEKESPLRFSLNNIRIEGGSVDFDDRPKKTQHAVRDLRIGIPFLSNIPSKVEITTQPVFEAKVNGAPFALHGKTKPFSETRETTLDLDFEDVDLPFYLAYIPAETPSKLTSGRLDAKLTIAFTQPLKSSPALVVSGSAALRKLALAYQARPIVAWDRFEAVLDSIDVFGKKARIRSLKLVAPELWIRRETSGDHDIVRAFAAPAATKASARKRAAAGSATPETAGPPFAVEIAEMGIEAGRVHYDNLAFHPPFHAVFGDLAVRVKGFSTEPGRRASVEASAKTDAGEVIRNTGTASMEPVAIEGLFSLEGAPLKRYTTFLEEFVPVALDDGVLDLKARYRFSMGRVANTTLSGLSAAVRSPRVRKKSEREPFFRASSITVADMSLDLAKRELVLGELESAGGYLAVVREKDGTADLLRLVPEPPPVTAPPPPSAPWNATLKKLALSGYTVKIDDRGLDRLERYALTKANVLLENLSTAPGTRGSMSVRFGVDGKGLAKAKGPVGFKPIFADLKVDVKGIDLVPIEAYVLQNLRLSLARGAVTAAGTLSLREDAGGKASVVYAGSALVADLLAVDQSTKLDFLRWESFSAEGMKAGYNPLFLEVSKLAVSGVACDITIEADGTLNLRNVLGKPAPPEGDEEAPEANAAAEGRPEPAPPVTPLPAPATAAVATPAALPVAPAKSDVMPIRIDALTLQGGRIGLNDRFVKPNYSATVGNLGGRVTGLSSVEGTIAEMDLRGSLANHSPLQVSGSLNLLAATAFADIKASFRDIDLPAFTPYSGAYAGYTIARGTLTVEVAYKLENRKLNASNRFLVDQFELGDKVESKRATKLPVKLAVSLLKDKDGVIDLDLPIEGSLDDPKFRIGKLILKVLVNLVAKAATAPFALLGRLLGGKGEEFSSVDFADGRDTLDDAATKKLDALAKALHDRPQLKLEATGRFSGDADLDGLRRARFQRKVKAQKLVDLAKKNASPASVDDVLVDEKEYADYLTKAYKKEKFPKPRNAIGIAKSLPVPEMEKLMLANITVTGDDLRQLALARANAVKDQLTGAGKVEAARVFVLEPGEKPAESKDRARASRVDFSLK